MNIKKWMILGFAIMGIMIILISHNFSRDASKITFQKSMNNLIRTANNYYVSNKPRLQENIIFDFKQGGQNEYGESLTFAGIKPKDGTLIITKNGDIHLMNITDGTYYANYEKGSGKTLEITKLAQ